MARVFSDLLDDFALFEDWQGRYGYLIDLGKDLIPLTADEHCSANKVSGCVSKVWLVTELVDGKLFIRGDSDAHIVRGLIAILCVLYSGQSPRAILAIDARSYFEKLGFGVHLTPQRSNGFYAMVRRICSDAAAALADCSP